jgi:hypothetical protein
MVRMSMRLVVAGSADCPAAVPASTDLAQFAAIPLQPWPQQAALNLGMDEQPSLRADSEEEQ